MHNLLEKETGIMPAASVNRRFLFAHWEGGGNTPPMLSLVRLLVAAGHTVHVLSDGCNRDEAVLAGASFSSWKRGYQRLDKSIESDMLRDWESGSPFTQIARLRDRLFVGPALHRAQDVMDALVHFPADAVVASEMLLGAMAGAEGAGVPCVAISANVYLYPLPGVPPFGPGFLPARGPIGRMRDRLVTALTQRSFGKGANAFNATRRSLGLEPLTHPFDQLKRVARHLVLTSQAFDFASTALPERVVYVGPDLSDPEWSGPWNSPWAAGDLRPLVLVSFSTTFQNQAACLQRVLDALSGMDVRAIVTIGPSLDVAMFRAAPNVHVCVWAPHSELMKNAAVVVTHAGHGTVIRSLASGTPLVCMPMGRDQNDNAARVVARGAGVRLSPAASTAGIRKKILEVLKSPKYRDRARELGEQIVEDTRCSPTLRILEDVARQHAPLVR